MKNQFWKKCKWILSIFTVCIVITTCTAYGKEKGEENKEDEWNVDFEIKRAEYIYKEQQNYIEIYYPQLCGLEDSAKEERIISIRYRGWDGYITTGHAALDDEVIATTIDIEEEKIVTLQDVVTDLRELSDMLLADEFEHITMWEGKAGGYPFSGEFEGTVEKLEENLREKPQEWYTDGENFIFVNMKGRYYNEYSISIGSVGHILDAEFLKKLGKNAAQEDNIVYEKAKAIEFENRYRILKRDFCHRKEASF